MPCALDSCHLTLRLNTIFNNSVKRDLIPGYVSVMPVICCHSAKVSTSEERRAALAHAGLEGFSLQSIH